MSQQQQQERQLPPEMEAMISRAQDLDELMAVGKRGA